MQIHRQLARRFRIQQLTEPGGDHPGEQVAGTAGGHPRIAGEIDEGAVVRARDDRSMPFEHDVHAVRCGELRRMTKPIVLHGLDTQIEQPRHFAWMWRDHHVNAVAADQSLGIVGKRVEGIGVQNQRHAGALDQAVDKRGRPRRLPEARPHRDHVRFELQNPLERGEVDGPGRRFLETFRHVFRSHRRNDGEARARRRDGDQPRA